MRVTTSLTPALSPRRGRTVHRVSGNPRDWIDRTIIRQSGNVAAEILSPGERTQVRASVTRFCRATGLMPKLRVPKDSLWCRLAGSVAEVTLAFFFRLIILGAILAGLTCPRRAGSAKTP